MSRSLYLLSICFLLIAAGFPVLAAEETITPQPTVSQTPTSTIPVSFLTPTPKDNFQSTSNLSQSDINTFMRGNRFFIKVIGEIGMPLGGDLGRGVAADVSIYHTDPYASDLTNYLWGMEGGYALDEHNGISIGYEAGYGASIQMLDGNEISTYEMPFTIEIGRFELNYYRYLPDRQGRWYAVLGAFYMTANSNYSFLSGPGYSTETFTTLVGNGIGASLGIGREWILFKGIGVDLSIRGLTGNIPTLQGSYVSTTNGNNTFGKGALVVYPNNTIGFLDVNNIAANNARYMTMDLTSINVAFSINFYI